jgi:hypothetical protein
MATHHVSATSFGGSLIDASITSAQGSPDKGSLHGRKAKVKSAGSCSCWCNGARNTVRFIKENWPTIILLAVAWGGIIAGMGAMYGFKATALPLTVGLGCGVGCGVLIGLLTVHVLDPQNEHQGMNTLWDVVNVGFYKLEANGTRGILQAVVITVVLWAAGIFPTPMGVVFGVFMGNLVIVRIGFIDSQYIDPALEQLAEDPLKRAEILKKLAEGHDNLVATAQTYQNQLAEAQQRLADMERAINALSAQAGTAHANLKRVVASPAVPRQHPGSSLAGSSLDISFFSPIPSGPLGNDTKT